MALNGTLKDFGIADIFQLISHQSKTGVLHLNSKDEEVHISFVNGDVVSAESTTRKHKDLLGSMLVRSGVISEQVLESALEQQKRTLKRLGNILLEQGAVSLEDLKELTRLQTTETIYKLFNWESGTYAFEAQEVDYDSETVEPIRSENILMEGFRMVDEWPMVRKVITSYEMTFKRVKKLTAAAGDESVDDEIDAAFDGMMGGEGDAVPAGMGANEVKVYGLVEEGRTVQQIIDLSRLGEFETCKALLNLLNQGYLKVDALRKPVAGEKPGRRVRGWSLGALVAQVVTTVVILGVVYLLVQSVDFLDLIDPQEGRTFHDPAARELIDLSHSRRLQRAIEVYRLEQGHIPTRLDELVQEKLVRESALSFPWRQQRVYVRRDGSYRLLRPLE